MEADEAVEADEVVDVEAGEPVVTLEIGEFISDLLVCYRLFFKFKISLNTLVIIYLLKNFLVRFSTIKKSN